MTNKIIFYVIGAVIIIGGIWYFTQLPATAPIISNTENGTENTEVPTNTMPVPGDNTEDVIVNFDPVVSTEINDKKSPIVKTFNVSASNFKFSVNEMRVNEGDTVKIVFTNNDGFHNWVIDEFNAKTNQISAGQTQTIEFVANKKGAFEYYCSVGQHRAMGMKGNLIVE